jgi:hypothetical protein
MEPVKPEGEIKEVQMDVLAEEGGARRRRRRRTRKGAVGTAAEESGPVVEKEAPAVATATVSKGSGSGSGPVVKQKVVTPVVPVIHPKVVIAPPKKKPARVLLVAAKPSGLVAGKPVAGILKRDIQRKTFRAKHVRLVIDNTAKTQKRRRQTLQKIDALTDEQVRQACLDAKLSRKETVSKVPVGLLRQMLKDYQTMRGNLL